MDDWEVKIEKMLVAITKDIEHIRENPIACEKETVKANIRGNRWFMGIVFTAIFALLGVIFTKI